MKKSSLARALAAGLFLWSMALGACEDRSFTPKPRGYPRVIYPEKVYRPFAEDYCHFTFDVPAYALIQRSTAFFEEKPPHPCWFDVYVPALNSRLHCSYYPLSGGPKSLEQLNLDAFELADWHNKRANYIDERRIERPEAKLFGFAFEIEGPAASSFQFYLTDSARHFLRAALYFDAKAQPDSLAPIVEFVRQDVRRMIDSFRWVD
jgi:gliding motility-associated lipoprotein GldD